MATMISARHLTPLASYDVLYANFTPPHIEVGDPVYFFENAARGKPHLGEVLDVSTQGDGSQGPTITVAVMNKLGLRERRSVRHIDDPRCQDPKLAHWGAWDYRPSPPAVRKLQAEVSALNQRLQVMEDILSQKPAGKTKTS